jgi:hypothetical protein
MTIVGGFLELFWGDFLYFLDDKSVNAPKICWTRSESEMKIFKLMTLLCVLLLPVLSDAQEIYRGTRALEEQQAISHLGQAEYYARMALRSLEASEKMGKAPYFNYQNAREDIERILSEFRIYLQGDESTDLPPAVPLIVDGRYFAESIKRFLASQKPDDAPASNLKTKNADARLVKPQTIGKNVEAAKMKNVSEKKQLGVKQNSAAIPPPSALTPQNSKTKKDKIEEILKKGL